MTVALELGPGSALARMLQARHPQIACRSVADFRSLDGIISWLGRQFD
jgi:[acyl-carrier-protein] S-malonyltransferase